MMTLCFRYISIRDGILRLLAACLRRSRLRSRLLDVCSFPSKGIRAICILTDENCWSQEIIIKLLGCVSLLIDGVTTVRLIISGITSSFYNNVQNLVSELSGQHFQHHDCRHPDLYHNVTSVHFQSRRPNAYGESICDRS